MVGRISHPSCRRYSRINSIQRCGSAHPTAVVIVERCAGARRRSDPARCPRCRGRASGNGSSGSYNGLLIAPPSIRLRAIPTAPRAPRRSASCTTIASRVRGVTRAEKLCASIGAARPVSALHDSRNRVGSRRRFRRRVRKRCSAVESLWRWSHSRASTRRAALSPSAPPPKRRVALRWR